MNTSINNDFAFDERMGLAPNPNGKTSTSKAEKYDWRNPGNPCVFREIDKSELKIDPEYQREATSLSKINKIAREFSWASFCALSVAERPDGSLWVWDGGHRLRAAWKRTDVTKVPCMVTSVENIKEEAKSFYEKNTSISNVSAYHRLKALNIAEDKIATDTMTILDCYGYEPSQDTKRKRGVSAVGTLMTMVADDFDLADKVFGLCAEICGFEDQPSRTMMSPIYWLAKRSDKVGASIVDDGVYRSVLIKAGKKVIEELINRETLLQGKGGDKVKAKAILDLLNKGKRIKLLLPSHES